MNGTKRGSIYNPLDLLVNDSKLYKLALFSFMLQPLTLLIVTTQPIQTQKVCKHKLAHYPTTFDIAKRASIFTGN